MVSAGLASEGQVTAFLCSIVESVSGKSLSKITCRDIESDGDVGSDDSPDEGNLARLRALHSAMLSSDVSDIRIPCSHMLALLTPKTVSTALASFFGSN